MPEFIKTERLVIKPFSDSDREALSELLLNEQIKATYMIPDFADKEALDKMCARFISLSHSAEHFTRGIYLSDRLIGFVNDVEIGNGCIELGYVISPMHWGRGFATEMLGAVIGELPSRGFTTVKAGAFSENIASLRVMEKCGMLRCPKTDSIEYRGVVHSCVYYEAHAAAV